MEKRKPWQLLLILAVVVMTAYNVLPTIFYYAQPLGERVSEEQMDQVATDIVARVDRLEQEAVDWLNTYVRHLNLNVETVQVRNDDPSIVEVHFAQAKEARIFRKLLSEAGGAIPFVPAQLDLVHGNEGLGQNKVLVQRRVGVRLSEIPREELFSYSLKYTDQGEVSSEYRGLVYDRLSQMASELAGPSRTARALEMLVKRKTQGRDFEIVMSLAQEIVEHHRYFGLSPLTQRYFASYSRSSGLSKEEVSQQLTAEFERIRSAMIRKKESLEKQKEDLASAGLFLDSEQQNLLQQILSQEEVLVKAVEIVRKNASLFRGENLAWNREEELARLWKDERVVLSETSEIDLGERNPLIRSLEVDWSGDRIYLYPHEDLLVEEGSSEEAALKEEKIRQLLISEMARLGRETEESLVPEGKHYVVQLNELTGSESFLTLNLGVVARSMTGHLVKELGSRWSPGHSDLQANVFPIWDWKTYQELSNSDSQLGLLVFSPGEPGVKGMQDFSRSSLYVIARGVGEILKKYESFPDSPDAEVFLNDFEALKSLLESKGFVGYSGGAYGLGSGFDQDFIFELDDYYSGLLKATREQFYVKGSQKFAVLEFTNFEQRLVTLNKIEDAMHEDLLKARDLYQAAQVNMDSLAVYRVAPPTKNVYVQNFLLSWRKYFRGDEKNVLKWGLDLQGGKTVRLEILDQNNRVVTDELELNEAVNQLYTRINKLGVSEQTIRVENSKIVIEFPGSQALSAQELIEASTMTFHMVNEKFNTSNPSLARHVNRFLQNVWSEAVVTNQKSSEEINEIAWRQLGGDLEGGSQVFPQTEDAKVLYEAGLRFAHPYQSDTPISAAFNDALSMVAVRRGEDAREWRGATHPLLIVFRNYALEGSSLSGVQAAYDSSEGNILVFSVNSSYSGKEKGTLGDPRKDLYAWTSQFAEERIEGTPKAELSQGRGWRMAVILNDQVISDPALSAALRTGGTIHGNFSQRDVAKLAADLKAGSLSFSPRILSETNISPDLGKEERFKGIFAACLGLALLVAAMIGYYRFAGVVAAMAVLFNLLIMWGVLQNIDAALSLPGIAALILTMGMAVDANVLVFERIREEFKVSGRIASAVQAGYRKAFSAIMDSNVTTIMAALILLQFDAGPIRGFAITLIIGIVSSMFTALFMTRYFFAGWVTNPKNKELSMRNWVGSFQFDFLGKARSVASIAVVLIVVGMGVLVSQRQNLLGMDFTGGYSVTVELEEDPSHPNYRVEVENALQAQGALATEVQVKRLNRSSQLRIDLSRSLDEEGKPFASMPLELSGEEVQFEYEKNPRLAWVVKGLEENGLILQESQRSRIHQGWNVVSGQFSDAMRNQALMAVGLALLGILLYISFRFEFKYGVAAIVALTHDVLMTLGIISILGWIGLPVQIDLQAVGALMTIIGYSLNDTIIIFDRIREDVRLQRKKNLAEVINHALNVTLGRTLITSGTTLLVLLSLVLFGGVGIFGFSLIMTVGVVFGTLSSLFIASPVMLYFHNREVENESTSKAMLKAGRA